MLYNPSGLTLADSYRVYIHTVIYALIPVLLIRSMQMFQFVTYTY